MNNQTNLANEEQEKLELIMSFSPSLRIAHELKEELSAIYNSDITPCGGMSKMKKRMHTPSTGQSPTR
jgi:uncharacterized protein YqeY